MKKKRAAKKGNTQKPVAGETYMTFHTEPDVSKGEKTFIYSGEMADKLDRTYTKPFHDGSLHDVYDVLKAFNVTCPAVAHAVKKLLCAGQRGHKTAVQDLKEAGESIARAIELANA